MTMETLKSPFAKPHAATGHSPHDTRRADPLSLRWHLGCNVKSLVQPDSVVEILIW